MAIAFYMDQHVPKAITVGLRLHDIDVVTAYEDGSAELADSELLDRAGDLRRVLFSQDDDLLAEATERQRTGRFFAGVIYAHQMRVPIGTCIRDLEIVAKAVEPEELINGVLFLPL